MASIPLVAQQRIYKGAIEVASVEVKRLDNTLRVSMRLDMSQLQVDRERALTLTPVLSDGTHQIELPFILINGALKHKAYARAMAIDRDMAGLELPYSVLRSGRDTRRYLIIPSIYLMNPGCTMPASISWRIYAVAAGMFRK
ncbi:MAG: DUF3868 domain-containing protein [Butyricimonas faecihominis]